MPSSVRRLTTLDHERLHRLLRRACNAGPGQERWRGEFVALLQAHRVAEREVVLEELVRVEALADAVRAQADTDAAVDRVAAEAAAMPLDRPDLAQWCEQVGRLLTEHAQGWADALMHPFEEQAPRADVRRIGGAYESRRDSELGKAGVAGDPPRRLDVSRAELYELARRAGIEGRSSMTRGELIDELQRRQG
jgi:hypothetical protein